MSYKGVCRTALSSPGLLKSAFWSEYLWLRLTQALFIQFGYYWDYLVKWFLYDTMVDNRVLSENLYFSGHMATYLSIQMGPFL